MSVSSRSGGENRSGDEMSSSSGTRLLHDSPMFVQAISKIQRHYSGRSVKSSKSGLLRQMRCAIEQYKDTEWAPSLFSLPREVPYEMISYIVEHYPDSLLAQSKLAKRSPLHYACLRNYSTRSLVAIARCKPEHLSREDSRGKHPINYLTKETALASTLSSLREIDPLVFTRRNTSGDLPINVACRDRWSIEAIKVMAGDLSYEMVMYNPLFDALRGYRDNEFEERVLVLLRTNPWLAEVPDWGSNKYPLHYALDRGIDSLPLIHELVESFPIALRKRDKFGDRPYEIVVRERFSDDVLLLIVLRYCKAVKASKVKLIFSALMGTRSTNVIRRILDAYPSCLKERDLGGKLPLHYLLASWSTFRLIYGLDLLQLMVDSAPKTLLQRDERGCTPLAYACAQKVNRREFECLFRYPGVASFADASGMLPIHHLLNEAQGTNEEEVLYIAGRLLEVHPQSITTCDDKGRLPLHWACHGGAPLRVIEYIFNQYPDACSVVDSFGMPAMSYLTSHVRWYDVRQFVGLMSSAEQSNYHSLVVHPMSFVRLCEQNEASLNFLLDWCDNFPASFSSQALSNDSLLTEVMKTWSDDIQCFRLVERMLDVDVRLAFLPDSQGTSPLDIAIMRYCESTCLSRHAGDSSDVSSSEDDDSSSASEENSSRESSVDWIGSSSYSSEESEDVSEASEDDSLDDESCSDCSDASDEDSMLSMESQDDPTDLSSLLAEPRDALVNLNMVKRIANRINMVNGVEVLRNPLLFALSLPGCSLELVHELMDLFPDTVTQIDAQGRNLLHIACCTRERRSDLVQTLFAEILQTGDIEADAQDCMGNPPLFHAASNPYLSLDTLFFIAQRSLNLFPAQGNGQT